VATARSWLDAGAHKVILGTAATKEVLAELPRDRVIAALDGVHGEVVVEGWKSRTGRSVADRLQELRAFTDHFLITFVELEGRLGGIDLARAAELVKIAQGARITFAGGVTTAEEVAALDRMGADAQVGMALYSGRLDLSEAFAAPLISDREDGLFPTIVEDVDGGTLGLCYSSRRSLKEAIDTGTGVYESRRRGIWHKGATSGATQELCAVDVDCDRDALRFLVRQVPPGFCHQETWSCFRELPGLQALCHRLAERRERPPEGSYTWRLLEEPELLRAKLQEEADELALAVERDHVAAEAADLLYFCSVALARTGVSLREVWAHLQKRSLRVTRRPGDAKEERI
jgi:phosphoribosyl-ATP pyrophosphohydrolase